jgi:hypothetical protein
MIKKLYINKIETFINFEVITKSSKEIKMVATIDFKHKIPGKRLEEILKEAASKIGIVAEFKPVFDQYYGFPSKEENPSYDKTIVELFPSNQGTLQLPFASTSFDVYSDVDTLYFDINTDPIDKLFGEYIGAVFEFVAKGNFKRE